MVSPAALAEEGILNESVGDLSQHPSNRHQTDKQNLDLEEHYRQGYMQYLPMCPACLAIRSCSQHHRSSNRSLESAAFFVPSRSSEQVVYPASANLNTGMKYSC